MRITSGLDGDRPGDAQPLLLAAGQRHPGLLELVLDVVPERGPAEAALDQLVHVALVAVDPRAEGDVLVDRLRERVRLLEDHPDAAPDRDRVDAASRTGPARRAGCAPRTGYDGTRSFIRLIVRSSVDFPQPDGPISAVTRAPWRSRCRRCGPPGTTRSSRTRPAARRRSRASAAGASGVRHARSRPRWRSSVGAHRPAVRGRALGGRAPRGLGVHGSGFSSTTGCASRGGRGR